MGPSTDMHKFREVVKSSRNIIVVAGAGLSAASGESTFRIFNALIHIIDKLPPVGIPTFRDGGGLWRKYDAMSLATPQAFARNPSRVWQFYHMRREK